jgi:hypothetical protein
MNRRELLKGAAMIPAALLGSRLPAMTSSQKSGTPPITAVVYDERYSDCQVFAEALARCGARLFPTNSDCAWLWYGTIRNHLAQLRGRVAGLTTDSDFMVSRMCGRELGLGVAYEGAHDGRGSKSIRHRLRGSGYDRELAAALRGNDACWAELLAQALHHAPAHNYAAIPCAAVSLESSRSSKYPGYLTSWLLEKSA